MSSILYNTNSSVIQRFQRNNRKRRSPYTPQQAGKNYSKSFRNLTNSSEEIDIPFESIYRKDSKKYLKALCCSIFPTDLHKDINKHDKLQLQIDALFALIIKNFVRSWYGVKIPTSDNIFIMQLYDIFHELIAYLSKSDVDLELLLFNDIPVLIGEHIQTIRRLNAIHDDDHELLQDYKRILLIDDDRYPYIFGDLVLSSLHSKSVLESTFLASLINELLLGRILNSVCEPYYILRGLMKVCSKVLSIDDQSPAAERKGQLKKKSDGIFKKVYSFSKVLCNGVYSNEKFSKNRRSIMDAHIFTLIFIDILQINLKKPFLYALFKPFQLFFLQFPVIDNILRSFCSDYIKEKLWPGNLMISIVQAARKTLFPNDNAMGPKTIIPVGEEFTKIKQDCSKALNDVLQKYHLLTLLGISREDIDSGIEVICQNKNCNMILLYRILDCTLAHIPSQPYEQNRGKKYNSKQKLFI